MLSLAEASARLGKSVDAVRSLIRRGRLTARRGNDGRLLVAVPTELAVASDKPGDQSRLGENDEVTRRVLAERDEALAEVDHWRSRAEEAAIAQARAEAERDAQRVLVDELRIELAHHRRPWWAKLLAR